jgi:BirA family biotin operon repressor/biotin-[acetyl-CoA-carboxylase] ligase
MKNSFYIKQTLSTNALSWEMNSEKSLTEGWIIYTDYQSAGKGQPGNAWESSKGMNLLFSVMLHPVHMPMDELFLISQLVSIAIKKALDEYTTNITVKWPNDIYWNDKKLAGILIENSLQGNKIMSVVVGIGLNVNQKLFLSNAPNPVSLIQITGKRHNRKQLLQQICQHIMELYYEMDKEKIRKIYAESLYRNNGFYSFESNNEPFQAKILKVQPDGMLELETEKGELKSFYFKEVQFIL